MSWRLVAALLVAVTAGVLGFVAASAGSDERGAKPLLFGFNEDWDTYEKKIRFAAAGGADTIRTVIPWTAVEPRPGVARWKRFDRLYGRMLANHARPLWVLSDAPCWAREIGPERCRAQGPVGFPPAESKLPQFALFAAQIAERYPESVAIESWNEPNLFSFWRSGPDPERAARLTAWVNAGVELVDPGMPVVLGGLSPVVDTVPGTEAAYLEFIRRAYDEVGGGHWDGVAIHPFPSFQRSADPLRDVAAHLDRVRKALRLSAARGTAIWVTEIGISTRGSSIPYSVAEQARGLVRIHRALSRMDDVRAMIVHRLVDLPRRVKSAEAGWGVVRRSGAVKPAYCALARERGNSCEPSR
ncbi:MAG: hypothetical protein ACR2OC_02590 [Solirubrobacterales bacterium]